MSADDTEDLYAPPGGEGENPRYSQVEWNLREQIEDTLDQIRTRPELQPGHPKRKKHMRRFLNDELDPWISTLISDGIRYQDGVRENMLAQNPELGALETRPGDLFEEHDEEVLSFLREDGVEGDELVTEMLVHRAFTRTISAIYEAIDFAEEGDRKIVVGVRGSVIRLVGIVDPHIFQDAHGMFELRHT